jgi:hypothetical protein
LRDAAFWTERLGHGADFAKALASPTCLEEGDSIGADTLEGKGGGSDRILDGIERFAEVALLTAVTWASKPVGGGTDRAAFLLAAPLAIGEGRKASVDAGEKSPKEDGGASNPPELVGVSLRYTP